MNLSKRNQTLIIITSLIFVLIISRMLLYDKFFNLISGDNAIWGIMSVDILQGKTFPIFFYGAHRTGSLETFFTAIFFALGGISTYVYHLSRIIIFAPFVLVVYFTVLTVTNDKKLSFITSLWAIFPSYYFVFTTAICAGYLFFLISSSLIFLTSLPLQAKKIDDKKTLYLCLFLCGFISGFAFWLHQLSLSFILVINLVLLIKIKREYPFKIFTYSLFIVFVSFVLGSLPSIIHNIKHEFHNIKIMFGFLFDISGRDEYTRLGLLSVIKKSLILKTSGYGAGLFPRLSIMASLIFGVQRDLIGGYSLMNFLIIVIWGILLLLSFYRLFSGKVESNVKKQIYILLAVSVIVFISGLKQDRYLLPFYFIIPVLISLTLKNLSKKILFPLIIFLITLNIFSIKKMFTKELEDFIPENNYIVSFLQENQLTRGYAEHNVAYPIIFLSQKKIIMSTLGGPFLEGPSFYNLIPRFNKEVERSPDIFYIYSITNLLDKTLRDYLQRTGITYQVQQIGKFNIYFNFTRKFLPVEFLPEHYKTEYLAATNRRAY
ncbi:MAG: hypothetical protein AB1401_01570 [Thermodesulfobacteriota bacterium]